MSLGTSFDTLSRVVERFESDGRTVEEVEVTTGGADGGSLHATLTVPTSFPSAANEGDDRTLVPEAATASDGTGVRVAFSVSPLAGLQEPPDAAVSASVRSADLTDDGRLSLTVALEIDPTEPSAALEPSTGDQVVDDLPTEEGRDDGADRLDGGPAEREAGDGEPVAGDGGSVAGDGESDSESAVAAELAATRDESLPPFEDVEYLRLLYDSCETFTEMSRLIEMDVASETVRRYMIDAGVHTPTSYDTMPTEEESDAEANAVAVADVEVDAVSDAAAAADSDIDAAGDTAADTDSDADPEFGPTISEWGKPNTASESTSASSASPASADSTRATEESLVADGVGLPNDVDLPNGVGVRSVVDAVVGSVTVHGVGLQLGLDPESTREVLRRLDLLEFVPRRIPRYPEQELTREDVVERIPRGTSGSA